jgi:hypothetical protein
MGKLVGHSSLRRKPVGMREKCPFDRKVYHNCNIFEGSEMRDVFQAGQAGAMGPHATAKNINFVQLVRDTIGQSSLADVAKELETVRLAMLAQAKDADQDTAVAEVAQAEEAAKKADAQGVIAHLKKAGNFAEHPTPLRRYRIVGECTPGQRFPRRCRGGRRIDLGPQSASV